MSLQLRTETCLLTGLRRSCDFERRIPFNFRCRSALCALPSVYPDPSIAILESPEPNRRQITQSFQVSTVDVPCIRMTDVLTAIHPIFECI